MSKQPLYEVEGRPVFYGDVLHCPPRLCSPVSDGGRGLKPSHAAHKHHGSAFARQRWRAWIETLLRFDPCQLHGVRPSAMAGVD